MSYIFALAIGLCLGGVFILGASKSCKTEADLRRHCIVGGLALVAGIVLIFACSK